MASLLVSELPASAVIRSPVTRKYLRYIQEADPSDQPNVGGGAVGLISTQEPSIFNPMSKIEVEEAKIDKKFVHLRFSHPNKYLARCGPSDDLNDRLIVATSDQPEEDRSKFSCTLFEPIIIINNTTGGAESTTKSTGARSRLVVSLRHVQSGGLLRVIPERPHDLVVDNNNTNTNTDETHFTFIISPRYVSFKIQNPVILKATITTETSTNTLLLESDGGSTMQEPEPTAKTSVNKLTATNTNRVLYRKIFNVHFDLEYAQVYDVKTGTKELPSTYANNNDEEGRATLRITYQGKTSFTLTNSQPLNTPVPVDSTVITAAFPRITGGGTVTIPGPVEETKNCGWNSINTTTETVDLNYEFVVPPRSLVRLNLEWKAGNFTVPFTYSQSDEFSDGTSATNDYDDGSYTGFNYYDFNFVPKVQPL